MSDDRIVLPPGTTALRSCPVCTYRSSARSDAETVAAMSEHFLLTQHHLRAKALADVTTREQ